MITEYDLLLLCDSDPKSAVDEIRRRMGDASGQLRHGLMDMLVATLLNVPGNEIELEARARELVELDRDATHLQLLALALERSGKGSEAEVLRREASIAPNRHITDEIKAMVAEAGIDAPWLK